MHAYSSIKKWNEPECDYMHFFVDVSSKREQWISFQFCKRVDERLWRQWAKYKNFHSSDDGSWIHVGANCDSDSSSNCNLHSVLWHYTIMKCEKCKKNRTIKLFMKNVFCLSFAYGAGARNQLNSLDLFSTYCYDSNEKQNHFPCTCFKFSNSWHLFILRACK